MRFAVVVNDLETLRPEMTTSAIVRKLRARDHQVQVVPIDALSLDGDEVLMGDEPISRFDVTVLRTSPGRDPRPWAAPFALQLLAHGARRGAVVTNDPDVLRRCASKLFVHELDPSIQPRGLVTRSVDQALAFLERIGGVGVVKPLDGTGGRGVARVRTRDELAHAIDTADGPIILQEFLDAASEGDVRILLWRGTPLSVDSELAAVRRRPASGEFRSNVSLGGTPEAVRFDATLLGVVARARPTILRFGLELVGLDVVGDRVVEVNVFSPGGLDDASRFAGVDFVQALCERYEALGDPG